jgi:hypothetical protein
MILDRKLLSFVVEIRNIVRRRHRGGWLWGVERKIGHMSQR